MERSKTKSQSSSLKETPNQQILRLINFRNLLLAIVLISLLFVRATPFLQRAQSGSVDFTDTLRQEPEVYEKYQYFSLGGYRIKASSENEYKFGDTLHVIGEVNQGRINDPQIQITGKSAFYTRLYTVRLSLREQIFKALPQPEAGLLSGILIGMKEDLPVWFSENLQKTGTIHVVVVSGYNISIIAAIFLSTTRFLGRRWSITLSLSAVAFYTILVGADPPAVRAAIMASLAFLGVMLGRQRSAVYFLFLAALIMFVINPTVVTDIGFQLSFLATAGIIYFQPQLQKTFQRLPGQLKDDFSTSLAAQILVVPIIFYHFGSVSAISPVANAAVLWIIPIVTVLGFVFLLISYLVWPVALVISWVIWAFLHTFVFLINLFASLEFTYLVFDQQQILPVLLYYIALVALILFLVARRKNERKDSK